MSEVKNFDPSWKISGQDLLSDSDHWLIQVIQRESSVNLRFFLKVVELMFLAFLSGFFRVLTEDKALLWSLLESPLIGHVEEGGQEIQLDMDNARVQGGAAFLEVLGRLKIH